MMDEAFELRMVRYLSGEAIGEEKAAFEQELAADDTLRAKFEEYERVWLLAPAPVGSQWDTDKAWNKFSQQQGVTSTPKESITRRLSWAVAAAMVIALGAAVFLWNDNKSVTYTYAALPDHKITLEDGSDIHLNKNAEISVYSFSKKSRRVKLEGEAFFNVASNPQKPFIVLSGESETEVVGTSFNIEEKNGEASIYVVHGKVIFRSKNDASRAIALTAGEAAMYKSGKVERIINPSPNISAWQSHQLSFINMPVGDIVSDISKYFGREIIIENEASKNCRTTITRAKDPKLESILQAVALSFDAILVMEGEKCILRGGKDCNK